MQRVDPCTRVTKRTGSASYLTRFVTLVTVTKSAVVTKRATTTLLFGPGNSITITTYFIHPSGKLKLSFDLNLLL